MNDLINYVRTIFQHNNIPYHQLDECNNFNDLRNILDNVWGWESDEVIFLFEGYFRMAERQKDKLTF